MEQIFNDLNLKLQFNPQQGLLTKASSSHMVLSNQNELVLVCLRERKIIRRVKAEKNAKIEEVGILEDRFYYI